MSLTERMTPAHTVYLADPLKQNLTKKVGLQRIIFNIFQLTSTEAMSSCEGRFVKIGVVFHALYFDNEVGDTPFFCISDIGNSLCDCCQNMKKICIVEVFRANVLKVAPYSFMTARALMMRAVVICARSHKILGFPDIL